MTKLLSVVLLLLFCAHTSAVQFSIQAIWPLSGSDAATYQQWTSAAKLAAVQATQNWPGSESLTVDAVDNKDSIVVALQRTSMATMNSSVYAVMGDKEFGPEMSALTALTSTVMVAPNAAVSYIDTTGLGFYSLVPPDGARVDALKALLQKYAWTKVGVLYVQSDLGTEVLELVQAIPGLDRFEYGLDPLVQDSFEHILDELYRLSVNIIIVIDPTEALAATLFQQAVELQLFNPGRAWIYLNDQPTLPTWAPQGTIVIHAADATAENSTLFQTLIQQQDPMQYPGMGPGASLSPGATLVYDAVWAIASAIERNFPATVTTSMINASMSSTFFYGYSGEVDFGPSGFRKYGHVQLLTASHQSGQFNVSMTFETSLVTIEEPLWPGMTTVTPDDQVDNIPIALVLDFSGGNSTPFDTQALLAAMSYAVYRINDIPGFLPANKKVCPILYDDETKPSVAVLHSVNIPNLGVAGVIGGMSSSISIVVQDIIAAWNIPQIAPSATAPQLSNKDVYPTFSRVCSSAKYEGDIVLEMCGFWDWTELSIISTLDAYGSAAAQELLTHAADYDIDIHEHLVVDPYLDSYDAQLQRMKKAEPRILVLLVGIESIANVIRSMHRIGLAPPAVIATDSVVLTNLTEYSQGLGDVQASFFEGWVVMGQPGGTGPLFDDFVTELDNLDPTAFPGVAHITGSSPVIVSCFDAVYTLADSIRRCLLEPGCDPRNGTAMLPHIRSIDTIGLTGHITMTPEGDRETVFEIRNVRGGMQTHVGRFDVDEGFHMDDEVVWPDGTTNVPLSVIPRIENWLKWNSAAGIAFSVIAALGIGLCLFMMLVVYWQRNSPVITSATWEFLILMLCGGVLGFGSVWVWIGKPVPYLCALRIWIPPVAFVIMLAPLLAKTWRLVRIFSLKNFKVEPIALSTLIVIVAILTLVQIIICVFWISLGTIATEVVPDPHNAKYADVVCKHPRVNKIASYVTYAYNGVLVLVGCYLAFRVRKLPKDFNESAWIVRAIYNVLLFAGLIVILGYSLSTHIVTVTILIVVCTLGICFGTTALIMMPKLWELYVHPERRSSSSGGGSTQFTTKPTMGRTGSKTGSLGDSSRNSKNDVEMGPTETTSQFRHRSQKDYSRRSQSKSSDRVEPTPNPPSKQAKTNTSKAEARSNSPSVARSKLPLATPTSQPPINDISSSDSSESS